MTRVLFLIITTFILAILSGIIYWKTLTEEIKLEKVSTLINQIKEEFKKQKKPSAILSIDTYFQQAAAKELINPQLSYPQSSNFPFTEWQTLINIEETCSFKKENLIHSPALKKALIWTKFICHPSHPLPDSFFTTPPFMHPKGISYLKLALESKESAFQNQEWIFKHKNFFHIQELLTDTRLTKTPLHINPWQLFLLIKGESIVQTEREVFFLSPVSEIKNSRIFYIYPLEQWNTFLKNKYLNSKPSSSVNCLYKESNIC